MYDVLRTFIPPGLRPGALVSGTDIRASSTSCLGLFLASRASSLLGDVKYHVSTRSVLPSYPRDAGLVEPIPYTEDSTPLLHSTLRVWQCKTARRCQTSGGMSALPLATPAVCPSVLHRILHLDAQLRVSPILPRTSCSDRSIAIGFKETENHDRRARCQGIVCNIL